ncbi:monocarboxylate transporter 3-like [Dermacentor albipictus]|uniref:monocarboxylate transporter 3-like n=1 Tax=Dermacentor albipictus TaxID=60249 RepID=UPI0031FE4163
MTTEKRLSSVFTKSSASDETNASAMRRQSRRFQRKDIDKSWGIAAAAAIASFFNMATQINSGFYFVAIMDTFAVDFTDASWPGSVFTIMIYSGSFVVVLLQKYLTVHQITLFGSLLLWVPLIGAAFAPNITCMTITLGALHGAGAGIVLVGLMVILGMHFDKYLGAASGIRDAGTTVCAFAFPSLLSFLSEKYGLRGTLFIYSALAMHVMAVAFWLWMRARVEKKNEAYRRASFKIAARQSCISQWALGTHRADSVTSASDIRTDKGVAVSKHSLERAILPPYTLPPTIPEDIEDEEEPLPFLEKFSILKAPSLYVVVIGAVVEIYGYNVFLETIDSYAVDKGAPQSDADMAVTYATMLEIIGYVALPLVADMGFVGRPTMAAACFVLTALFYGMVPHAGWSVPYLAVDAILVMFVATTSSLRCSIMTEFFGADQVPVCMAASGLLLIPVQLCSPSVIGYFRDDLGSYDGMYQLLAALNLLAALLYAPLAIHVSCKKETADDETPQKEIESTRM